MSLKEHKDKIVGEAKRFTVLDYKGDEIEVVKYGIKFGNPLVIPKRDEINEYSYTKDLGGGKKQSFFGRTFHKECNDWYQVEIKGVELAEWEQEIGTIEKEEIPEEINDIING